MTKRILFHYSVFNLGGAEMSSLRMMRALADRGWDITLVVTTGGGAMEASLDPRVHLKYLRPGPAGERFLAAKGTAGKIAALPDLAKYGLYRLVGGIRMLPFLLQRFDATGALLMGMPSVFIRRFTRAKTKFIWIRNDLTKADPSGRSTKTLKQAAPEIDNFICVSQTAKESLVNALPEIVNKAVVVYNILDTATMLERAKAPTPKAIAADGPVKIVSVCRLSDKSKALFRMVRVAQKLVARGFDFRWYIAGDGPDHAAMQDAIDTAGLSQKMILLGAQRNPFPVYKSADIVAMLSYFEGLCGIINEARVLDLPVIATQVSGINEQLTNDENGIIVPQDEDAIVDGLERLLNDANLRARLAAGGYPDVLLNDDAKLDHLETLFLGKGP